MSGEEERVGLFESKAAGKGKVGYRVFASTILVGICLTWIYRIVHLPRAGEEGRWTWIGMFMAELFFAFYWILTQSLRFNVIRYNFPNKETLSQRYEDKLPGVDIFVCTADPVIEPPTMVINTILSVMSFNYPPEKLSVYLSDDSGSEFTFYAMLEASRFSKYWIPFSRKFNVEPMSPEAYFAQQSDHKDITTQPHQELLAIMRRYEDMKNRIKSAIAKGSISEEIRDQHRGFSEWKHFKTTKQDHQSIVQIIIDGKDTNDVDNEGNRLPTLVYMAREKRPRHPHNFKAGALNALLEFHGFNSYGAAPYCGTGCFHRRESLCGAKYSKDYCRGHSEIEAKKTVKRTAKELEEASRVFATCSFEMDTQWGKEMGLLYGCASEDVLTGLAILCRGWKSMYYNPNKKAFIGVAPNTLETALVQFKRWSEGLFHIFFSKYCPFIYGHGKIRLGAQMGYSVHLLWAPLSLPTIYYTIILPLCLLHGISLFPKVSSLWFIPFAYVFLLKNAHSIFEALSCGSTLKIWWNYQRMQVIRMTTACFFGFIEVIIKQMGLSQTAFAITAKVVTEDVLKRYEQEAMEFGSSSLFFTIVATLAMLNLFSLVGAIRMIVLDFGAFEKLILQVVLCGLMVLLNLPIYEALFVRRDKGCLPFPVMFKSIVVASLACLIPLY